MGEKDEFIKTLFANDYIEMVNEIEIYNIKDTMANSYHIYDMPEFETKNMDYVLVPQIEYLCMLEVGATCLVNQAILEKFAYCDRQENRL